ncbi:S8 family serine peptidase [Alienimonas sp. DA493]|uniref:S8 family serine peptidase n=1 Tax=Alienimonas sp. DA493 TaxID=3373605 RepID=UPI003753E892
MATRPAAVLTFCLLSSAAVPAGIIGEAGSGPRTPYVRAFHGGTSSNASAAVGAERFYAAGYTGTRAYVANIEGGHAWNGHQDLTGVNYIPSAPGTGTPTSSKQGHATATAHNIAGVPSTGASYDSDSYNSTLRHGIAFGVQESGRLYSGNVATAFGSGGSFSTTTTSVGTTYKDAFLDGMGGAGNPTADVVNGSWGFRSSDDSVDRQIRAGFVVETVGIDAMIAQSGAVSVFSAGNDQDNDPAAGADNNVGGIGAGYNSITVGALGPGPDFDNISTFSSRGAAPFFDAKAAAGSGNTSPDPRFLQPSGAFSDAARAVVDIVAPGTSVGAPFTTTDPGIYHSVSGTSFAAPIVAGGAALVVDAGKDLYGGGDAIDGRVVKAVLLNSANKNLNGYDNGQFLDSGVVTTFQSLDLTYGAGALDLDAAFEQYVLADTAGVLGNDGGLVGAVGWDLGSVSHDGLLAAAEDLFFIGTELAGGSVFTTTLTWFAERVGANDTLEGTFEDVLVDLDLEVFRFDALTQTVIETVAQSISAFNVVEHLSFELPEDGYYGVRVSYFDEHWDFGDDDTATTYGLAWSGVARPAAVPEPGTACLVGVAGLAGVLIRRRKWRLAA